MLKTFKSTLGNSTPLMLWLSGLVIHFLFSKCSFEVIPLRSIKVKNFVFTGSQEEV